ncbi:hypothetical protein [Burkholderia sp. BCC1985]|uniref:hypothetical protein n=1 Tax=Burkholderia sp. BCC1985 TaxID=2817442 RepID=UPI002AB2021A|nr:hypothetical protein [Burkholderia sp. BCC1985]
MEDENTYGAHNRRKPILRYLVFYAVQFGARKSRVWAAPCQAKTTMIQRKKDHALPQKDDLRRATKLGAHGKGEECDSCCYRYLKMQSIDERRRKHTVQQSSQYESRDCSARHAETRFSSARKH